MVPLRDKLLLLAGEPIRAAGISLSVAAALTGFGLIAVGVTKLGYFWKLFPFIWGPCFVAYFLRDCHLLVVKLRILKRCDARQHRFSPGEFYSRFIRRKYAGHWR